MAGNGGARPGAGRKPKSDEKAIIDRMDAVMAPAEVWKILAKLVKAGDAPSIKLWLNYRHGMPKQQMDIKHEGDVHLTFKKDTRCEPLND